MIDIQTSLTICLFLDLHASGQKTQAVCVAFWCFLFVYKQVTTNKLQWEDFQNPSNEYVVILGLLQYSDEKVVTTREGGHDKNFWSPHLSGCLFSNPTRAYSVSATQVQLKFNRPCDALSI